MEMLAECEGYREVPVDIDEFIEDDYYLGRIWGGVWDEISENAGQPKVYPFWRDVLRDIYPNPFTSPYHEINITGGIGLGKTTVALIGILYDLYKMLLVKEPQAKYSLGLNTKLITALFTATKKTGNIVLYSDIMDSIHKSPFFSSLYSRKPKEPSVIFPGNVGIVAGSQFGDALGMAVFQGIIDEANFQNVRINQVIDTYNNLKRRMVSRFLGAGGSLPSRLWVLSSKKEDSAFLEEHINRNRNNPRVKIIEAALWEAKGHTELYTTCKTTFPVFIGDTNKDPSILVKGHPIPETMDISRVIDVPSVHYEEFEFDLMGSLRDLAGKSTASKLKLFRSRELLDSRLIITPAFGYEKISESGAKEIVGTDVIVLDSSDSDKIRDYLSPYFWEIAMKGAPHFIHMDMALTGDRFGMAMCHAHSTREISRLDHATGKKFVMEELVVMFDFVIGLKSKVGEELDYSKVREFIIWLREQGFNLGSVNAEFMSRTGGSTYDKRTGMGLITADDRKASADMLQLLRKQGFETSHLSVDIKKDAYLAFKRAIVEDRVYCPRNKILLREMLDIEDTGKKFDHPNKSSFSNIIGGGEVIKQGSIIPASKDCLDATVGAYWSCIQNAHSSQLYSDSTVNQMKSELSVGTHIWNKKYGTFM